MGWGGVQSIQFDYFSGALSIIILIITWLRKVGGIGDLLDCLLFGQGTLDIDDHDDNQWPFSLSGIMTLDDSATIFRLAFEFFYMLQWIC